MFEALLISPELPLETVVDAIDIYEGSLPPAATFSIIDPNTAVEIPPDSKEAN